MFNWLGRKSGRGALLRYPLAVAGGWDAGEPPAGYEARVCEGLLRNPVASRAVRLVAESVGAAPLTVSGGPEALLAAPNPRQTGPALMEALAAHLLLNGNAYLGAAEGEAGRPAELHALRPERISIEADASGWPSAYVYRTGARETRLPASGEGALLHIRMLNPVGDHYGLGCLDAASGAIATHNAAAKWNRSLLANAARPSGALLAGDETLSRDQFERLKGELESCFSGAGQAGRPMLLEGGLKWQTLSMTPADMDFAGTQAAAARDIALALGVPPMLLGLPGDNTYANYSEANRALWRLTVLPLASKITGALGGWLRQWWPDAAVAVEVDRVPALAADRERLWAQVSAADFLSGEEKRRLLGLAE
jgi:HK97 family phage portal protein